MRGFGGEILRFILQESFIVSFIQFFPLVHYGFQFLLVIPYETVTMMILYPFDISVDLMLLGCNYAYFLYHT